MSDTDFNETTHNYELNTPPTRAKKSRMPLIIIGGLLSLALCLALVFLLAGGPKDARLAVNSAAKAAIKLHTDSINAAYKNISALDLLFNSGSLEKGKSQITFTFNSISGIEGAQEATAMLTGSGFQTDTVYDAESFEIDTALMLLGQSFLDFYAYYSPELITAGIPSFSADIIGINPKTILQDLSDMGIIGEDELQSMTGFDFDAYLDTVNPQIDTADIAKKVNEIYTNLMEKGEYTHEGTQKGAEIYRIKLDGDDVKAALRELAALILSYSNDTETAEDALAEFDEGMIAIPTDITLSVADGAVQSFTAEMRFDGDLAMLTVAGDMSGTSNTYTIKLAALDMGEKLLIEAKVIETITDEKYSLQISLLYDDGYSANQTISALFTANADGSYSVSADFASVITFDVAGTVTKRGDKVTNDIGKLSIGIYDEYLTDEPIVLDFSLKCVTEPFTGKITPSREYTLFTDLSEDELIELGELYVYSFESLLYSLIGY